jgi:adenylate kinase
MFGCEADIACMCVCLGVPLVADAIVVELFLDRLLQPQYQNGVLIDGFPRTTIQVNLFFHLLENVDYKVPNNSKEKNTLLQASVIHTTQQLTDMRETSQTICC